MTKSKKSYIKRILKNVIIALNVSIVFFWTFWSTGVLTDGLHVDTGDQLQFACVTATVVVLGYLLASLMRRGSMGKFWSVMTVNIMTAPVFMTMVHANDGMTSITDFLFFSMVPLTLSVAAPFVIFLILEE